jgi:hypothetical protein
MGTASGSEGVLAAFHEAFGILKTAIRTGGTPEPLPELPRLPPPGNRDHCPCATRKGDD